MNVHGIKPLECYGTTMADESCFYFLFQMQSQGVHAGWRNKQGMFLLNPDERRAHPRFGFVCPFATADNRKSP